MQSLEAMPIGVNVRIYSRPASPLPPELGTWQLEGEAHNLIVTTGKVLVARMLAEDSGFDTGLTYCEVGTNTTAPALTDTTIGTVTKRNAITAYRRTSNRVQFRTFFAAGDITAFLKAIGLYGHSTATATDQTGELFNHAKISFDNSSGAKDLTAVIEVTFG
jgi:hypothetical protein